MSAARTYLFVPATRLDRLGRAWASGCDAVIVDLEDAVADADKAGARDALAATALERPVHVRVNAAGTAHHEADLAAVAALASLAGVVLPMAERPEDVAAAVAALPEGAALVVLVETPRGLLGVDDLLAVPGVTRVAFGSTDWCAALGVERTAEALAHPRSVLAVASAAARLPAPVDGPHLALDDDEGLRSDVADARRLGLHAKLCIHPRQVAVVRGVLRPSADDARQARALLAAAEAHGGGVFRWQGMMVDGPVLAAARATVVDADPDEEGAAPR